MANERYQTTTLLQIPVHLSIISLALSLDADKDMPDVG